MVKQKKAQSVIEFTLTFIILLTLFMTLVEVGLYYRANYSLSNLLNEIIALAQVSTEKTEEIQCREAYSALQTLENRAGVLFLNNETFTTTTSGNLYTFTSATQFNDSPKLVLIVNCVNPSLNKVEFSMFYTYTGLFMFKNGKTISSSQNYMVQKY